MSHTSGKILLKLVVKRHLMSMSISLLQRTLSEKSKILLNFCFVLDEVKTMIILFRSCSPLPCFPLILPVFNQEVTISACIILHSTFWSLKFPYHLEFIFLSKYKYFF